MSSESEKADRVVRACADLLSAVVLTGLGIAVTYLSWVMPRLEVRNIPPSTIPGLVPLILGAVLTLCAVLLGLRALRIKTGGGWRALVALGTTLQAARVAAVLALAFFYTLVLVGWLPFWAATMIFIFCFVVLFEVYLTDTPTPLLTSALWALAIAVVAGGGIFLAFEEIFLVRLP